MITFVLRNCDPDDIGDVLAKVQKSFGFEFGKNELQHVKTFGDLCDAISSRLGQDIAEDCMSQQAFYKLRDALAAAVRIDDVLLSRESKLDVLLPRRSRRKQVAQLQKKLDMRLDILRPPKWVLIWLLVVFIISMATLIIDWRYGLGCLGVPIFGFWISNWFGNRLEVQKVEDLVKRMVRDHYLQSRRNPATINTKEVESVVKRLFSEMLGLDPACLTREAAFS